MIWKYVISSLHVLLLLFIWYESVNIKFPEKSLYRDVISSATVQISVLASHSKKHNLDILEIKVWCYMK